jgi:hypothetical protein
MNRSFHPLRMQRWSWSDYNPWLWWVGPAAQWVRANRIAIGKDDPMRRIEAAGAAAVSAALDYYRQVRDAYSEATFFQTYGPLFGAYLADQPRERRAQAPADPRELPFVQEALAGVRSGGFAAAVARAAVLLARHGEPLPLARLSRNRDMLKDYAGLLPDMAPDQWRRLRGEQEIIVSYAPQEAVATLPELLSDADDRARFRILFEQLLHDPRLIGQGVTDEQQSMLMRIDDVLDAGGELKALPRRRVTRKAARKGARK